MVDSFNETLLSILSSPDEYAKALDTLERLFPVEYTDKRNNFFHSIEEAELDDLEAVISNFPEVGNMPILDYQVPFYIFKNLVESAIRRKRICNTTEERVKHS